MKTIAVAKAILIADGKILLLQRSADDYRRPLQWDLPGGALDADEDCKQACAREVWEEAGISLPASNFRATYAMTEIVTDGTSCTFSFFRANVAETEPILSSEHQAAYWVTLSAAQELITYDRHLLVLDYVRAQGLLTASAED
jgi:8-oxo-dGTP diphosphatase